MSDFDIKVKEESGVIVVTTNGYLNNFGGEQVASICLQKIIKGYDSFLEKKCPYVMGLHAAPSIKHDTFHFHIEFYPPLRHGNKPKVLAGSELMAGVYIMDVLPEETAKQLREYIQ